MSQELDQIINDAEGTTEVAKRPGTGIVEGFDRGNFSRYLNSMPCYVCRKTYVLHIRATAIKLDTEGLMSRASTLHIEIVCAHCQTENELIVRKAMFKANTQCPNCLGGGLEPHNGRLRCQRCQGTGQVA